MKILEAALKDGYLLHNISTFLIIGAGGVGKSSFLAWLVNELPSLIRRSTALATEPICTMPVSRSDLLSDDSSENRQSQDEDGKDEDLPNESTTVREAATSRIQVHEGDDKDHHAEEHILQRVGDSQLSKMLADAMHFLFQALTQQADLLKSQSEGKSSTKSASSDETKEEKATHQDHDKSRRNPSNQSRSNEKKEGGAQVSDIHHKPSQPKSQPSIANSLAKFEEELCKLVSSQWGNKKLLETEFIHLIDSGGQPQFHEVLPILLRGLSMFIPVCKLSEPLTTRAEVGFYKDGKMVNKPFKATYNHEQIIRRCMRGISSDAGKKEDGECSSLLFVATHRDEAEDEDKALTELDKKIHQLIIDILPKELRKNVITRTQSLRQPVFPLNTKSPDSTDKKRISRIRTAMMQRRKSGKSKLPLKWYGFELALKKLMEELGRQVLDLNECLQVALKVYITEDEFEVALQHLSDLHIIAYYPGILPNVVFGSIQVVIDKVTEIVTYSMMLAKEPSLKEGCGDEWRKFRQRGIISHQILSSDEFQKHHIPDLFGPTEVLKLFEKLLIASPTTPLRKEYLMPCLLQVDDTTDVAIEYDEEVLSYCFQFPDGGPELGTYCATNNDLLSARGWQLAEDGGEPVQVSRNSITYELPGDYPGRLKFIDPLSSYFEVRIIVSKEIVKKVSTEVCPAVRYTLLRALESAKKILEYTNGVPESAFLCPSRGQRCSFESHLAQPNRIKTLLVCMQNTKIFSKLTEEQMAWITDIVPQHVKGDLHTQKEGIITVYSREELSMTTLQKLKLPDGNDINICQEAAYRFMKIGNHLLQDKTGAIMQCIRIASLNQPEDALRQVFSKWLQQDPDRSWSKLLQCLQDCELNTLAHSISIALGLHHAPTSTSAHLSYIPTDASSRTPEPSHTAFQSHSSTDSDSQHIQSMAMKKKHSQPISTPSQSSPMTAHTALRRSEKPKFRQLRRLKEGGKTLKIIQTVSTEWEDFAYNLEFPRSVVREVSEKYPQDEVSCCEEVVEKWLDGEEGTRQPVSWATLIEAVRECEDMDTLATDIENILS